MPETKLSTAGLWYFAHPYTVRDADGCYVAAGEEANFRLCCWRSGRLLLAGYNIYSPIAHTHPIHMATPEFLERHEHEMWYRLDEEFILEGNFTGLILAPEWEWSVGCCLEHKIFTQLKKPIRQYTDIQP